uniref:Uncharacterized protein n=1 Tax=Rhizophora mucronata TaxID=61149 RepID=A0A2P2PGF6_RHIMU
MLVAITLFAMCIVTGFSMFYMFISSLWRLLFSNACQISTSHVNPCFSL